MTICTQDRATLFGEIVGAALCGRPNNFSEPAGMASCPASGTGGRPDNADKMISKWLMETENKFPGIKIDKYVIMPNHIHFLVYLQGGHAGPPLHEIVEWFKTMTTNEYIKGVKTGLYSPFNKRIWQRNYFERIIRDEAEYQQIGQYI